MSGGMLVKSSTCLTPLSLATSSLSQGCLSCTNFACGLGFLSFGLGFAGFDCGFGFNCGFGFSLFGLDSGLAFIRDSGLVFIRDVIVSSVFSTLHECNRVFLRRGFQ